jgi:hypothetical protein
VKKFRFFTLEGMADELEYPSEQEQNRGIKPQAMEQDTGNKKDDRNKMVGIPSVWQARLTGCWWLVAYCAIHCSLVRRPNMAR